ncbi:ABC transporter permease [Leucobacter massiliensis]|uniref:Iron ABC transporter permease n=1 Tax=Leucobacter massiliensis TaxID=1686285 RepID=A0A2S9QSM8_9MICO|nr:iron ABC transporter permease [Leucobacter massiliensis]PRI12597.1 iron ABC transporter permease [Leucobacter massiliensis]
MASSSSLLAPPRPRSSASAPAPAPAGRITPDLPRGTGGTGGAPGGGSAPAARRAAAARWDGLTATRIVLWGAVAALVLVPLGAIVSLAVSGSGWAELASPEVLAATGNSLVSAGVSGVLAVLVGTGLALLLERTDLPGRRALRLLALSPMLMPPFVGAIAWLSLLGPSSGLNTLWTGWFGAPLWNLYGGEGVVFLLTLHSYPVAMMIVTAALRRVPADLEQAARIAGSSAPRALWEVTTPLLRPAMLSAFALVAVSNLADFGIPSIIGLPERYTTLSTLVYRFLQSGTVEDPLAVVSAIGFVLLLIALLGVVLDLLRTRSRVELDAQAGAPAPLPLGRARGLVAALTAAAVLATTLLPLVTLAMQALLPAPGVPFTPETVTLESFERALTASGTLTGIGNSLMLATLAGVICGVLGLLIGAVVARTRARGNGALLGVALLPQAIPGLVIAVAWLVIAPRVGLANTPWLILCAYLTSFLALVVQSVHAPLAGTPATAEEAARVSGASRLRALWDISCRMAVPAAISGAVLVGLTAVRELTLSVLLLSPGSQTLGVVIFNLQQAGAYNASSALSLIVAVAGLAGLGLTARAQP